MGKGNTDTSQCALGNVVSAEARPGLGGSPNPQCLWVKKCQWATIETERQGLIIKSMITDKRAMNKQNNNS